MNNLYQQIQGLLNENASLTTQISSIRQEHSTELEEILKSKQEMYKVCEECKVSERNLMKKLNVVEQDRDYLYQNCTQIDEKNKQLEAQVRTLKQYEAMFKLDKGSVKYSTEH